MPVPRPTFVNFTVHISVVVVYSPLHRHETSAVLSDITNSVRRISGPLDTAEWGRWMKLPIYFRNKSVWIISVKKRI